MCAQAQGREVQCIFGEVREYSSIAWVQRTFMRDGPCNQGQGQEFLFIPKGTEKPLKGIVKFSLWTDHPKYNIGIDKRG